MNTWLAIFLGGGAGSVARFAISSSMIRGRVITDLPWATLTANLLASALLAGLVLRWGMNDPANLSMKALLVIGFCGGFSTFSTFSYENYLLLKAGMHGIALANVLVSVGSCLLVFYLIAQRS